MNHHVTLFITMAISYVLRVNLSGAISDIETELWGQSKSRESGFLLSAINIGYLLSQLVTVCLTYNQPRRYCVVGIFGASIATLIFPCWRNYRWFLSTRIILGIFEGLFIPSTLRLIKLEDAPVAAMLSGTCVGTAITFLGTSMLCHYFDWSIVFYSSGILAFLWGFVVLSTSLPDPSETKTCTQICEALCQVPLWPMLATIVQTCCSAFGFYFFLTWLPGLLHAHNFDFFHYLLLLSTPYLLAALVALISAKIASRANNQEKFHSAFVLLNNLLPTLSLMILHFCQGKAPIAILTIIAIGSSGFSISGQNTYAMTIGELVGSVTAVIANCFSALSGFVAPFIVGLIVAPENHGWPRVFLITAIINAIGAIVFMITMCFKKSNVNQVIIPPVNEKLPLLNINNV